MLTFLAHLTESWASLYSNSAPLRTVVEFAHVGGLVAGGGTAIAADRLTIQAARHDAVARQRQIHHIENVHFVVLGGLTFVVLSGLLLFLADVETYVHSKVFWLKMACVVVLIVNGVRLVTEGRRAEVGSAEGWLGLKRAAIVSLVFWSVTTLLGVALPNV
jgi:uncharacterized membrane protein